MRLNLPPPILAPTTQSLLRRLLNLAFGDLAPHVAKAKAGDSNEPSEGSIKTLKNAVTWTAGQHALYELLRRYPALGVTLMSLPPESLSDVGLDLLSLALFAGDLTLIGLLAAANREVVLRDPRALDLALERFLADRRSYLIHQFLTPSAEELASQQPASQIHPSQEERFSSAGSSVAFGTNSSQAFNVGSGQEALSPVVLDPTSELYLNTQRQISLVLGRIINHTSASSLSKLKALLALSALPGCLAFIRDPESGVLNLARTVISDAASSPRDLLQIINLYLRVDHLNNPVPASSLKRRDLVDSTDLVWELPMPSTDQHAGPEAAETEAMLPASHYLLGSGLVDALLARFEKALATASPRQQGLRPLLSLLERYPTLGGNKDFISRAAAIMAKHVRKAFDAIQARRPVRKRAGDAPIDNESAAVALRGLCILADPGQSPAPGSAEARQAALDNGVLELVLLSLTGHILLTWTGESAGDGLSNFRSSDDGDHVPYDLVPNRNIHALLRVLETASPDLIADSLRSAGIECIETLGRWQAQLPVAGTCLRTIVDRCSKDDSKDSKLAKILVSAQSILARGERVLPIDAAMRTHASLDPGFPKAFVLGGAGDSGDNKGNERGIVDALFGDLGSVFMGSRQVHRSSWADLGPTHLVESAETGDFHQGDFRVPAYRGLWRLGRLFARQQKGTNQAESLFGVVAWHSEAVGPEVQHVARLLSSLRDGGMGLESGTSTSSAAWAAGAREMGRTEWGFGTEDEYALLQHFNRIAFTLSQRATTNFVFVDAAGWRQILRDPDAVAATTSTSAVRATADHDPYSFVNSRAREAWIDDFITAKPPSAPNHVNLLGEHGLLACIPDEYLFVKLVFDLPSKETGPAPDSTAALKAILAFTYNAPEKEWADTFVEDIDLATL
jgi:hypothetical protein